MGGEIDLDGIEVKARAATPGPWEAMDEMHRPNGRFISPANKSPVAIATGYYGLRALDDAAFIATLDPQAALALVARIREAEARASRAEKDRERLVKALEPFGKAAGLYFEGDECLIISGTEMSIGDLRTAATLLNEIKGRDADG